MNIIVTGGAGFIGSNFVFHMLKKISRLQNHLSGQADLCRKPLHTGASGGQSEFPFCEGRYL